jgi:hypothetical protein
MTTYTDDLTEEELAILRGDVVEDEEEEEEVEEVEEEEVEPSKDDLRFTQLMEQVEASRERNAWLEDQLSKLIAKDTTTKVIEPLKELYPFEAKEEEYVNLIIEGEIAKATKLRSQIDNARTTELLAAIRGESKVAAEAALRETQSLIENEKFSKTVEILEEKHPFFNPDHKSYNAEAVDTANSLMNGFIAKGDSKVEALKKAVARILPFYGETVSTKGLGGERKSAAGKVAADASNRQPPKSGSVKGESTTLKTKPLSAYTDKEFAALTNAELKALRGDM